MDLVIVVQTELSDSRAAPIPSCRELLNARTRRSRFRTASGSFRNTGHHLSVAVPDGVDAGCYLFGVNSGITTVCPRDVMLYRSSFTGW